MAEARPWPWGRAPRPALRRAHRPTVTGWGLAAATAVAGVLALALLVPTPAPLPGPLLQQAQARGELRVGVREYPRPSLPSDPQPPEPDNYDAALARHLAQQLGVPVTLVGLPPAQAPTALATGRVDLVLAGSPAGSDAPPHRSQAAYVQGPARLVVLRNGPITDAQQLADRRVCVAEGSPYAAPVTQRHGAQPLVLRSAVHAVSAFMAGECVALAEDEGLLARLLAQPEWRYYRLLPGSVAPAPTAQAALAQPDAASARYLDAVLAQWHASGHQARALLQRTSEVVLEVALLQDGAICH